MEKYTACDGGGSIKKNGIYGKVMEILKANGKNVFEDAGVMANPTVQKLFPYPHTARKIHGKILCLVRRLALILMQHME